MEILFSQGAIACTYYGERKKNFYPLTPGGD